MSQFLTSNELLINIKNPPKWNPKKHYFDQSIDVLDFYLEEGRKLREGITIGGYFIHPWLYWHINYFKTPIPQKNGEELIMNPPLDDNILYTIESYQEAEQANKGLALFGTRGFSKSSQIASLISWLNTIKENGVTKVIGGDKDDLAAISRLIGIGFNKVHPAFFLPQLVAEWDKNVELGIKEKDGFRLPYSHISISNADGGTSKKSEKGAGPSPIGFIIDECGKFNFRKILESALPSFKTQYGAKLVHVLSGTSGNEELTADAKEVLGNPEAYDLIMMNWDRLDRSVPEEAITWSRSKKEKFSIFVPGQMSYRLEVPKIKTNLAAFLGLDHPGLASIDINTTNWLEASKYIREKLESFVKLEGKEKYRMYYPVEIADVFLTKGSNPFPTVVIDAHIRKLEDEGRTGRNVTLYRSGADLKSEFSSKKRSAVSHGGGEADAPVIVFGEIPTTPPAKFTFVSGLDDYKLEQSDTSSLGAFYVLKRRGLTIDSPCETIAASYTGRPFRHVDFHIICETMLDGWGAICCMEAIDVSFKQFLDTKHKAEQCLAPGMSFSNTAAANGYSGNSKFGIFPTKQNNDYMFDLLIDYCKEPHVIGIDDNGNEIVKYGVEYIEDIDLLKEMLSYRKGGNFDRISAFKQALAYARELDKTSVRPKEVRTKPDFFDRTVKKVKMSVFGNKRPSAF
jgi:hypothetical protein